MDKWVRDKRWTLQDFAEKLGPLDWIWISVALALVIVLVLWVA